MGNKLTYNELLNAYNETLVEVDRLKSEIADLKTVGSKKGVSKIDRLIFDRTVKQFVNLLPQIVYQSDINGNLLFLNNFALKSFGYSQKEFKKGINVRQVLNNESDFLTYKKDIKERLTKKDIKGRSYTLKKKDGTLFYGLIYSKAVITSQGNPIIFGIIIDHTEYQEIQNELLKTQSELKELNAAKDKLFSIIAHDLKNPFNAISGFSELMLSEINAYSIEQIKSYIKIIHKSSIKGYNLLENLLDWTRSQTGNLKIEKTNFNLSELIYESIALNKEKAQIKNIELTANCNKQLKVTADKNMINTVLRNLIANALKFTKKEGSIKIFVNDYKPEEKEPSFVKISIKDTGIGIKKIVLEKIFKLDETHTTKGTDFEQGTGLGLILCKDFVMKNGGKIWAESEFGKGSTFNFTLPKYL